MFKEGELLRKARGLNLAKNPQNAFQKECYCRQNDRTHAKDTVFDAARRERLVDTYFGSPQERDYCLLLHTKQQNEARFMRTWRTVSQNLEKLQELGARNWDCSDMRKDKQLSSGRWSKPRTALTASEGRKASSAVGQYEPAVPRQARSQFQFQSQSQQGFGPKTAGGLVRIFSPQERCYIERPACVENQSQQLAYCSMRNFHNEHSVDVCKSSSRGTGDRGFEGSRRSIEKPYTVSAETYKTSWVDGGRAQTTTNYESAKFDVINHGCGVNASVSKLIKENPKACYKIKSIAEFSDLTRVTAPKPNHEYQAILNRNPNCFAKASALCAQRADIGKTFGPFFKLFK